MAQLEIGKLIYSVTSKMDGKFKQNLDRADKSVKRLGGTMKKTTKATDISTASVLKSTVAIAAMYKAYDIARNVIRGMIQNASDLTESINAVNVVFGEGSDDVLKYGKNAATSVGLARAEYNQMATITGALLKDTGLTMDEVAGQTDRLITRAADLASVFNTDVTDATSAINQAIRGETEGIRRYAGDVSDATLQTYLLTNGIAGTVTQMSQQEKRLLRVEVLMAQTEVVANDFANTSDSLANQQRILTARFKDASGQIGTAFLPAISNVLKAFVDTKSEAKDNSEAMDSFGRTLFRVSNVVIVLGATISNLGAATKIAWNVLQNNFISGGAVVLKAMQLVMKGLGKDTETIDGAIENLADQATKNFQDMGDAIKTMGNNNEKIQEAMGQIWNPTNYVAIDNTSKAVAGLDTEIETLDTTTQDASEAMAKAKDEMDGWRESLLGARDEAKETAKTMNDELTDSFEKFGGAIKDNLAETNSGLADIVIGAEAKRKELKDLLKNTDDKDERRGIKDELKEVKEIFDAEKKFEERRADELLAIRTQLEEAGIDASKLGLETLQSTRTLEEEIEEKRRVAGLDDFTRFKEQQSAKLQTIVTNFIKETNLLQAKIDTQKQFEADLTDFLSTELTNRQSDIDAFASVAIARYGDVASSIENLISQQARLAEIPNLVSSGLASGQGISLPTGGALNNVAGGQNSTTNTVNNNVSPTVNIAGSADQNLSATELSAILGYELSKFLR